MNLEDRRINISPSQYHKRLMAGLKKAQDAKTGGGFMIVDKGDRPDNWIDPSGTAMFVYSIRRGVELGLLDKAEYGPVAVRGFRALRTCRHNQRPRPGGHSRRRRRHLHPERL